MARIRTIKPEFWVDDQMVELDFVTRLLFIGLWNFVDDEGFIEYKPKRIKMQVFPADDLDVSRELQNLLEADRLSVCDSDQGELLHVINWERHQKISNPTHTKFTNVAARTLTSEPVSLENSVPVEKSSYRSALKGKEGKGRERNEAPARGTRVPDSFSINKEMRDWASTEVPLVDIDKKLPEFIDYWTGVAGAKGVKRDWLSTWRNGMRKQQEFAEIADKGRARPKTTTVADIAAHKAKVMAESEARHLAETEARNA